MFSLDDRPAAPTTPAFSAEMEQILVSAARTQPDHARRKRRAVVAVAGGASALAVAAGAAIAVTGRGESPQRLNAPPVHVHLADFAVDTNAGGTLTVTLSRTQILDPGALQQALADAGVPARITIGSACYNPHPSGGAPSGVLAPGQPGPNGTSVVVITPSKLPAGSTLAIGYLHTSTRDGVHFAILTAGAPVTCSDNPPQGGEKPVLVPGGPAPAGQSGGPK
jgi:hypothetical protein